MNDTNIEREAAYAAITHRTLRRIERAHRQARTQARREEVNRRKIAARADRFAREFMEVKRVAKPRMPHGRSTRGLAR